MKVPRKKKKKIPQGVYCYVAVSQNPWTNAIFGAFGIRTKECPFYKHIDGLEGHCRLLKSEIIDQVKNCKIKKPF